MSKLGLPPPAVGAILVVEDERDVRESFRDLLESEIPGGKVIMASNGNEALEILKAQPVDVILCDYRMPGMDGLTVLTEARRIAPGAARILITAFPELGVAMRSINEAQVHNFLTKPASPKQLLAAVNAALLKNRASQGRAGGAPPPGSKARVEPDWKQ
ncbi:MAG: response regulator [Thermoplasmatota archaeon]